MRLRTLCLAVLLAAPPAAGHAQTKARTPAGPETRYFTAIDGLMGDADVILKELRQDGSVTAATIDVCYDTEKGGERKDRFVANLAVQGNTFAGTTQSIADKKPVTVKFTQREGADGFNFKGEVSVGQAISRFDSTSPDISEAEFSGNQPGDETLVSTPTDFSEVSPDSVSVKLRLESAAEFLKSLRGQPAEIAWTSLNVSCADLRTGATTISLTLDPFRAGDFVAKARSFPGVLAAGWSSGGMDMTRAIRFSASGWRDADGPNRDKIALAITDVLAKAFSAKTESSRWAEATGKLTMTLTRPRKTYASLSLTEILEFTAILAPESGNGRERLVLSVTSPMAKTRDDGADDKLIVADPAVGEDSTEMRGDPGVVDLLAARFSGQRWDFDTSSWK